MKKRWHAIPVGIITVILLACLVAGSAFAAIVVGTVQLPATGTITVEAAHTYIYEVDSETLAFGDTTVELGTYLEADALVTITNRGEKDITGWDISWSGHLPAGLEVVYTGAGYGGVAVGDTGDIQFIIRGTPETAVVTTLDLVFSLTPCYD